MRELGNGLGDFAGEVAGVEAQASEEGEVADGGRNREVELDAGVGEENFGNSVGCVVAFEERPGAAVGFGIPGEGDGVAEVFFELEEGIFVIWVAPL